MPDVFRVQVRPGDQERLGYAAHRPDEREADE